MGKILSLIVLLVLANLYLLRPGLWTFQDASYWPKSTYEAFAFFNQQFQTFTTYGFYQGYDQGLLTFTRIFPVGVIFVLFQLFGSEGSQAAFSILGMILTFGAFFLFSGIVTTNRNLKFLVSLGYTFSPWVYQLQGHTYFAAAVPLFLYAFYGFIRKNSFSFNNLFLALISILIWVSYIRFVQAFFIIIAPYVIYWLVKFSRRLTIVRSLMLVVVAIMVLSPTIISFGIQLAENSQTAFSYSQRVGYGVTKPDPLSSATFLFSNVVPLYTSLVNRIGGVLLFILFVGIVVRVKNNAYKGYFLINVGLFAFGLVLYNLGNIVDSPSYFFIIKWFPFVTNNAFFALYLCHLPVFALLLFATNKKNYYFVGLFVILLVIAGLLPLLDHKRPELAQLDLNLVPTEYEQLFPGSFGLLPEASLYLSEPCWHPLYATQLDIPKPCLNYGYKFSPISLTDPRLATNTVNEVSQNLLGLNLDDLQRYLNLKHVIYPNDSISDTFPSDKVGQVVGKLAEDPEWIKRDFNAFDVYTHADANKYDYLIYAISSDGKYLKTDIRHFIDHPDTYYVRVEGDESEIFSLFLSRSFTTNWRIKEIAPESFYEQECLLPIVSFSKTNNSSCEAKFNISDRLRIIITKDISSNHLSTQYSTNEWQINHDGNSEKTKYLLIQYRKSAPFGIAVILSLTTLSVVILGMIGKVFFKKI